MVDNSEHTFDYDKNNLVLQNDEYRHDLRLYGALAMLSIAEIHDIGLNDRIVSERLGYDMPPLFRRVGRSLNQMREVQSLQHEAGLRTEAEFAVGRKLTDWLAAFSPATRETIQVQPSGPIDDYYLTPMKLIAGNGDNASEFDLGQHFGFFDSGQDYEKRLHDVLPKELESFLGSKRAYWKSLGVENAGELGAFMDQHFTYINVDLDAEDQEPEIDWLLTSQQELTKKLVGAERLRLRRMISTPKTIHDHIFTVSQSQHRLFGWLEPYVGRGQRPVIHTSDREAIRARHLKSRVRIEQNPQLSDFRRKLLLQRVDKKAAEANDFELALTGIANMAQLAYGVEVTPGSDITDQAHQNVTQEAQIINKHLDVEFGAEKSLEYMMRDVNGRNSESIIGALKVVTGLIAVGQAMQWASEHFPPLAWLSALIPLLAIAEDPASEIGEALVARKLGYSWQEIAPRYKLIGPVSLGSLALGSFISKIATFNAPVAVTTLAVASCATTVATLYKNIDTAKQAYLAAATEGKVAGHINLGEAAVQAVCSAIQETDGPGTAYTRARREIETQLAKQEHGSEITKQDLMQVYIALADALFDEDKDYAKVVSTITVSNRQAWGVAWEETMANNPARIGKMFGIIQMLIIPPFIADAILNNVPAMIGLGANEAINGMSVAYIDKKTAETRREKRIRKAVKVARSHYQSSNTSAQVM